MAKPVAGVGQTGCVGQRDPPIGGSHHHHVADWQAAGQDDPEIVKDLHAAWTDEIAAGLVPWEARLVDQCDASTAAGEHEGGDASRRSCATMRTSKRSSPSGTSQP